MYKILLLLLGVVVLNEVDGSVTSVSTEELSNIEDGREPEVPYIPEDDSRDNLPVQKRSGSDKLMRRSSLDKNFMRFGRSGFRDGCCNGKDSNQLPQILDDPPKKRNYAPPAGRTEDNFIRFGRSPSENFMRFGRDDSFMRFGRGDKDNNFMRFGRGDKDNGFIRFGRGDKDSSFIRFGRGDKDGFIRFGRGDKDNFMRFGRGDDNFMRFGRRYDDGDDSDEIFRSGENFYRSVKNDNFMRFGKSVKNGVNFLRFGKSGGGKDNGFIRFGRNGNNFLRFGRGSGEEADVTDEIDDANPDSYANGPVKRRKRMVEGYMKSTGNSKIIREIQDQTPKPKFSNLSA